MIISSSIGSIEIIFQPCYTPRVTIVVPRRFSRSSFFPVSPLQSLSVALLTWSVLKKIARSVNRFLDC